MTHYFFIKLSEKVKQCNPKQIKDCDFEFNWVTEGFTSAWFTIHTMPYIDDYNVIIRENGKVYLAHGDEVICEITGQDAENWKELASNLFYDRYADEIENEKKENAHWSWVEHQDNLRHLQRQKC